MKKLLALSALLLAAACGKSAAPSSQLDATIDQRGHDVTVLQAWYGDGFALSFPGELYALGNRVDPASCATRHVYGSVAADGSERRDVSCKSAFEKAAQLPGFDRPSPSLTDFRYTYDYVEHSTSSGTGYYTQSGLCEAMEFRTVIRDAALSSPTFNGIGFYLSRSEDGNTRFFVDKSKLHAVGHVTLADGAPATVHRFISQGMCFGLGGNGDSIYHRTLDFRPFARFGAEGNEYNVWDQVPTDYHLGFKYTDSWHSTRVESFDRQNEILQH